MTSVIGGCNRQAARLSLACSCRWNGSFRQYTKGVFYKFHALLNLYFRKVALCVFLFLSGIFHFLLQSHSPLCSFRKKVKSARLKFKNPSKAIYRTRRNSKDRMSSFGQNYKVFRKRRTVGGAISANATQRTLPAYCLRISVSRAANRSKSCRMSWQVMP